MFVVLGFFTPCYAISLLMAVGLVVSFNTLLPSSKIDIYVI